MTPWVVACQFPLSVGFSRREYWSESPCPFPGDLHPSTSRDQTRASCISCTGRQILYHLSHERSLIFNWMIIALQRCVGCCLKPNMNQPSVHTCSLPLHPSSHLPVNPSPLGCHRAPSRVPHVLQQLPVSDLFYIWWRIYVSVTLSIRSTLSCPYCVHKPVLYVWDSIPALQIGSSIPFF